MDSHSSRLKILFKVNPQKFSEYEQNAVHFSKPRLVAYYDYNYGIVTNAKRIKYFKNLEVNQYPIDLNQFLGKFVYLEHDFDEKCIKYSLKYDMSPAAKSFSAQNLEKTKVITRRGTLVHIMESYYNEYSDLLKIRVSRYNNNLYIERDELPDLLYKLSPADTHHSTLEKIMFADSPDGSPEIDTPCDQNKILLCVHRSTLGKYDVIYSGEIQGIIDSEKITDFDDLDTLTDRRFVFTKQMWKSIKNKDTKFLKIWLQSYLANVKDVYIGYKTVNGILDEPIEHVLVKDLHKNCRWKPAICLGILHEFLQNVEKRMSSVNCLNTVYVFQFNKRSNSFTYEIFNGKTDETFITEEYMEYCKENF